MTDDNPWAEIVGPCYTGASVARALGWTPQQVAAAVQSLSLLELETSNGVLLYPAFQIVDGRVVDGVADVLHVLNIGTRSTWTWAQWVNMAVDDETGNAALSAIEQLREGHVERVLRDARLAASSWSM